MPSPDDKPTTFNVEGKDGKTTDVPLGEMAELLTKQTIADKANKAQ